MNLSANQQAIAPHIGWRELYTDVETLSGFQREKVKKSEIWKYTPAHHFYPEGLSRAPFELHTDLDIQEGLIDLPIPYKGRDALEELVLENCRFTTVWPEKPGESHFLRIHYPSSAQQEEGILLKHHWIIPSGQTAKLWQHAEGGGVSAGKALKSAFIHLEAGSHFHMDRFFDLPADMYHLDFLTVVLESDSTFTCNSAVIGGRFSRFNIRVLLKGERASATLNGFTFSKSNTHCDHALLIEHLSPHCESSQFYKGLADDRSTIVFNGKIYVSPHAQKTNAFQSSKHILLSKSASIYSKPELEINADDVKCSHGASTGQIDQNALFYMQARGIQPSEAKRLLYESFALQMLDRWKNETGRMLLLKRFHENLNEL